MKNGTPPLEKHETVLPSGWTWATPDQLRTVAAHALGIGPFGSDLKVSDYTDSGCPLIFVRNIRSGRFDGMDSKFVSAEKAVALKAHIALPGDVLVTKMGDPPGDAYVYPLGRPPGVITADCIRLRVDPRIATGAYVVLAIGTRSARRQIQDRTTGVAQQKISLEKFRSLLIPLAPLSEQHRIVDEVAKQFTRLDAAVAGLQRVKANLKRYRASVLKAACEGRLVPTEAELARREGRSFESGEELLKRLLPERRANSQGCPKAPQVADDGTSLPEGWCLALSSELFSFVTSGSRGWAKYYSEQGPLFLRIGNLDHDSVSLDLSEVQRVTPPKGAEGERTRVLGGDILVSITADVGMVALVPSGFPPAFINQHIALARPSNRAVAAYVAWFLASEHGGGRQFRTLQRGATKQGLGLDDVRGVVIPIPPLAEQHRIVAEVDRRLSVVDELEATVEKNLARCARLRQSILKMAFEGRLGPQDPNDEPASVLLERIRRERGSAEMAGASPRRKRVARR
ncbi:MAG: restriction endonuclease subunit S [Thermoanaerobaculia bacterium]